jgi:predicted nucleic acid-binding protein
LESGRASLWDGLLLATAREAGCTIALSEDMQDSSIILGVTVRNPFQAGGLPDDLRPLLGMA